MAWTTALTRAVRNAGGVLAGAAKPTSRSDNRDPPLAPGDWRAPARAGALVVVATFGILGIWAATARIDSAVIAHGSIVVESSRKALQHLEGGIVSQILTADGAEVREGQLLLRLDPTQAQAQRSVARGAVASTLAEIARLVAEAENSDRIAFPAELADDLSTEARRAILDQARELQDRRAARAMEVSVLEERLAQMQRQIEGTLAQRDAASAQVASIADEADKLRPLAEKGLIAAVRITALDRSRTELQGRASSLEADLKRLDRSLQETRIQIDQVQGKTAAEASSRLSEARSRLAEAREKLRVAEDVLARRNIRAPRKGRVVALAVHSVGAVVKPGETLLEIVPDDDDLVVSAKMSPMDVTTVHAGLPAEVRLPAFKARETPITLGEVRSVGADALRDQATSQYSYELRVSVPRMQLPPALRAKLKPGMPAEVIVATGERTVLSYLTRPLLDAIRVGMREN